MSSVINSLLALKRKIRKKVASDSLTGGAPNVPKYSLVTHDAVWDKYCSTPKPLPALMPAKFVCKNGFSLSKANGRSVKFSETTHILF